MAAVRFGRENKYNAKRADGFPSKLEASVYYMLVKMEDGGLIKDIRRQHPVVLQEGGKDVRISWKVDFSYENVATGERIFVEAKGVETNVYALKLKLWKAKRPYTLEIYKGHYSTRKGEKTVTPFLVERVEKKHEMPTLR